MKMKNLLFVFTFLSLLVCSCGASAAAGNGSDKKTVSELTKLALDEHRLTIEVNYINPVGMSSFPSSDRYKLKIQDGKVNAFLPFFGSRNTPMVYGVDASGIEFKDCPIEIVEDYTKSSRGKYFWKFTAMCGNETVDVIITFMNNASAQISCSSSSRSSISYSGEIVREEDPEE